MNGTEASRALSENADDGARSAAADLAADLTAIDVIVGVVDGLLEGVPIGMVLDAWAALENESCDADIVGVDGSAAVERQESRRTAA